MRNAARAIVLKDKNILLIKRLKIDKEYYTLPGGRVEPGEDPASAAIREVAEETSITVQSPRLIYLEDSGDPYGMQHVYMCDFVSGEPLLSPDSEEAFWTSPGKNTYEPLWFPIEKLTDIPFVSPLLKEALIEAFTNGFPDTPRQFSSRHAQRLS